MKYDSNIWLIQMEIQYYPQSSDTDVFEYNRLSF